MSTHISLEAKHDFAHSFFQGLGMTKKGFETGDWVVYSRQKVSAAPGPRAQYVTPSTKGDTYSYVVDKYWIVTEKLPDGMVRLKTRKGKIHDIESNDPMLRHASWWERLRWGGRFRQIETSKIDGSGDSSSVPEMTH